MALSELDKLIAKFPASPNIQDAFKEVQRQLVILEGGGTLPAPVPPNLSELDKLINKFPSSPNIQEAFREVQRRLIILGHEVTLPDPPDPPDPPGNSSAKFFIFVGRQDSGAVPLIAAAEAYFGKQIHGVYTSCDTSTYATMAGSPSWACSWQNSVRSGFGWSFGLRMIPNNGPTLSALVANFNSTYKTYFTQAANTLKLYNNPNCHIRLAWEANGNWNLDSPRHSRNGGADFANFKAAWILIVDAMKAVDPTLKFHFAAVQGQATADADAMLPVNANYIDGLGLDVYDQMWGVSNHSVWANRQAHLKSGIGCPTDWLKNLITNPSSRFYGKDAWLPECAGWGKTGHNSNGADQYGGDPLFVNWLSSLCAEGWVDGITLFNDNYGGANETVNGVPTGRLHAVITAGSGGGQSAQNPAVPTSDAYSGSKMISENHASAAAAWKTLRASLA